MEQLLIDCRSMSPDSRPAARQAFRELREQAEYQLWCYVVQREAVGLIGHRDVYATYRIPEWPSEWT